MTRSEYPKIGLYYLSLFALVALVLTLAAAYPDAAVVAGDRDGSPHLGVSEFRPTMRAAETDSVKQNTLGPQQSNASNPLAAVSSKPSKKRGLTVAPRNKDGPPVIQLPSGEESRRRPSIQQ